MKNRRFILSLIFSLFVASSMFAYGKKDVEEIEVENFSSWQEKFDIESKTKKKAVTYNIMVTASDLGGNQHVEGPFNIRIDPNSDLPVCGITNPYDNMRVVGNLNIVGTCIDDDGVSKVELILDEGTDHEKTVTAQGTEFWSYYLETAALDEGAHTVKVIGYDTNAEPLSSKPVKLTWQLDRKQPLTHVTELKDRKANHDEPSMGTLVSGTISLKGTVTDGNGIKELDYSIDGGDNFWPTSISKTKNPAECTYNINVDTKQFDDGPAVIWFKAIDNSGSTGYYSFLYYIDNTKPDVAIVYPKADEVVNGKFTVAGYAKDSVGLEKLYWDFGEVNGEIEIIPGNPYWAVNVDTIGLKDKSKKFTIHALDIAGNLVDVTNNIPLNQEEDKPVTTISFPEADRIYNGDGEAVYVRGIAVDDDSVQSVKISLDGNEPILQETKGTFYYELCKASDLTAGAHKITVSAVDENGVEGNPVTVQISSKGVPPTYDANTISIGKDLIQFENGMEIHPESGSTFNVNISSQVGIKNVHTMVLWGKDGTIENDIPLKNAASYNVAIPINKDFPKGVVQFFVTATDSIDRSTDYKGYAYITNTSLVKSEEPQVVFTDSAVDEDGGVILDSDYPLTGYVIGADIKSAVMEPATEFISKVVVSGNQLKLIPNMKAIGGSAEPSYVKVTTKKGLEIKSRPLYFKNDSEIPIIKLSGVTESKAASLITVRTEADEEGNETEVIEKSNPTVKGKVTCKTGVGKVQYKIFGAVTPVDAKKKTISKVSGVYSSESYIDVKLADDGSFSFTPDMSGLDWGMYLVEIVAESAGGNKSAAVTAFNMIPPAPERAKISNAVSTFVDSFDVYVINTYQGEQEEDYKVFPRSEMNEGSNALVYGKAKYTAGKDPTLTAAIVSVGDAEYFSGMPVVLEQGIVKTPVTAKVVINTGATVSAVSYEITGAEVPGGDQTQKGTVKIAKPAAGETQWTAEIPLNNLPVRVNDIAITIKAGSLEKVVKGSIEVVRTNEASNVEDAEKIYSYPSVGTTYDPMGANWILGDGSTYVYYANLTGPVKAELVSGTPGLKLETSGKFIVLSAEKDGNYKQVSVKVKDRFGEEFVSAPLDFLSDSQAPDLHLEEPVLHQWVGKNIKLSGTAADALGVRTVEYTLNKGETWTKFKLKGDANGIGVTFSEEVSIASMEDGLVEIDLRATDNGGHVTYVSTACFKDTTAPVVEVIEPLENDIVNGENLIIFKVTDNGWFNKAEYNRGEVKETVEINPLVYSLVGTKERPIESDMTFLFGDDAGNVNTVGNWLFAVDNKSDLPRTEIHVPDEDQVLTRDFTISGVVYDDDGPSSIWYSIDDGEFKQVAKHEVYGTNDPAAEYELSTSFSIDVPISTLTDNEHYVTIYAVDTNGVRGVLNERSFRVSLEEPQGFVQSPTIDTSVRGVVKLSGVARDKNGISKVEVSLDNGNTYNDAVGGKKWSYDFDTRAIPGGTQVVFLRVTDGYGIKGLYSSLINIDNEAPDITLELPEDDSSTTGELFFSGYAFDNVDISKMYVTIRNMEHTSDAIVRNFDVDYIIGQALDISDLPDGFYNVELTGEDRAGNKTNISRNIHLNKSLPPAVVDVLYPLNGEHKNGKFNIYGQASSNLLMGISNLRLYIDDVFVKETTLTDSGFFKFEISPATEVDTGRVDEDGNAIKTVKADITDGKHRYRIDAVMEDGKQIASREQTITYSSVGPWVTLDNFTYGDFAMNRPYIRGEAGYSVDPNEAAYMKTKEASKEEKALFATKALEKVEISFDNGKTFELLSEKSKWGYRVENEDMAEGYHFVLIRATMKNEEVAIERTIIQIDNTAPTVRLISPTAGGRYNQVLEASGLTKDEVGLQSVKITLRKGDKKAYEVPSFIQGLYLDFHVWGATLFDVGAGLTFFDDNVKVQFQWGQFTQAQRDMVSTIFGQESTDMRYGGDMVFGMKILANVASVPFGYFFGHDWDWLYANAAIGAQFTRFNQTNSGKPQILSAILGQIEFPRVVLKNKLMFSTFSLYGEFAGWFIPSDVSGDTIATFVPQGSLGFRVNVF